MSTNKNSPVKKDGHIEINSKQSQPLSGENADVAGVGEPVADAAHQLSEVDSLRLENHALREQAARALADYQNLERRQREEKVQTIECIFKTPVFRRWQGPGSGTRRIW